MENESMKDENTSEAEDEDSSSSEEREEEVEPKLKYERMVNDLQFIFREDAASCIAVHSKFIALGTHWGAIHVLDHLGNSIKTKEFKVHDTTVNNVVIDKNGDYVASCSDQGRVVIIGLYTSENNIVQDFDHPIRAIALDPDFHKPGSGRRFITGNHKLMLHEKSFLSRQKTTVLYNRDGIIRNIKWNGQFVAWSCDGGVRVFDMDARKTISLIPKDHDQRLRPELHRCNLSWKDVRTLLIGWADTVKVCAIKERRHSDNLSHDLPSFYVELVYMFSTNFYISGIAALGDYIVTLTTDKEEEGENFEHRTEWSRPQVRVLEPVMDDYIDLSTDRLSVRGFQKNRPNDYNLASLPEEGLFFIVSPKDAVVAKPRDADDHVTWLLKHDMFEEAITEIELMKQKGHELKQHNVLQVGRMYLNHLLEDEEFDKAGRLCIKILGKDKKLWEEEVYKFAKKQQLGAVSPYLPRGDVRLDAAIYEMVLNEFLQTDLKRFHNLICDWPSDLYNIPTIINAVIERLVHEPDNRILLQSLGDLHLYDKSYVKALAIYLKLGHPDVFKLITKHRLFKSIHDKLELLFKLDKDQAIKMLLDNTDEIPVSIVVKKLNKCPEMVYQYLDKLYMKDKNVGDQYYGLQVKLCAEYAPQKLLSFLRSNNEYPLEDAYSVCEERHLVPEMVFILARMGNTAQALKLITEDLQDIKYAIEFCKENDEEELWDQLIHYSVNRPAFLTVLLNNIGTHVDPIKVINKIEKGLEVHGLQSSLVQILLDYNLQISLREGCKKILVSDWFNLLDKQHRQQKRGICVEEDQVCQACDGRLLVNDSRHAENIMLFYCRHAFHDKCLPATGMEMCSVCHAQRRSPGSRTTVGR